MFFRILFLCHPIGILQGVHHRILARFGQLATNKERRNEHNQFFSLSCALIAMGLLCLQHELFILGDKEIYLAPKRDGELGVYLARSMGNFETFVNGFGEINRIDRSGPKYAASCFGLRNREKSPISDSRIAAERRLTPGIV